MERKEHKGKNIERSLKVICTEWIYGNIHE
jgi:hypothetical protein